MRSLTCALSLSTAILGGSFALPKGARAQTNAIAAEALFEDGRALMTAGEFAQACPKFEASQRIDASASTLLNLANCYEKEGKRASAWAIYREAASFASVSGRPDYLAIAQRRASAIEGALARLTVTAAADVEGLEIKRDGVTVARAAWGTPIPIDAGVHSIEATAPKKRTWTATFEVANATQFVTVTVPVLEDTPPDPPAPSPAIVGTSSEADHPAPHDASPPPAPMLPPRPATSTAAPLRHGVAIVAGSVGFLGVGVGTVFALNALTLSDESRLHCSAQNPNVCTPQGVSQRHDARVARTVAVSAYGIGGAALVVGLLFWLAAPRSDPTDGTRPVSLPSDATERRPKKSALRVGVAPTLGGAEVFGQW